MPATATATRLTADLAAMWHSSIRLTSSAAASVLCGEANSATCPWRSFARAWDLSLSKHQGVDRGVGW
jgi:hypothetical protein